MRVVLRRGNDLWYFSYFADNQRWVDLGTSRGIWHHTQYSACPGEQYPTAVPRTHSSKLGLSLSTPQNCAGWCRRWDIWGPGGSSCRHDSSTRPQEREALSRQLNIECIRMTFFFLALYKLIIQMSTNQFFIMQGAGSQGWGDACLPGILNQGLKNRREHGQSLSALSSLSFILFYFIF